MVTADVDDRLAELRVGLRPGQQRMADWHGGPLAVSAVPGAGKSTGMAIAAAMVLAQRIVTARGGDNSNNGGNIGGAGQELVVVTFTRSAAANLKAKIRETLRELGLPPIGFSVYTLHGLALHIAQRHPEQSGLNLDQMTLMTPTQGHRLIRSAVESWVVANPDYYQRLLEGQFFDGEETERLRRQSVLRTEVLPQLTATVIRSAKSSGLTADQLKQFSQSELWIQPQPDNGSDYEQMLGQHLVAIATGLFDQYQQVQRQRNTIDYDDMMVAALRVLQREDIRQWWQAHIFAVFEDEAQDSSPLQTQLLQILSEKNEERGTRNEELPHSPTPPLSKNLLRIGDPNQAINATFTPADPIFFREFCAECDRHGRLTEMTHAGRSSPIIMDAANFLLDWLNQRYAFDPPPFRPQRIESVPTGDPQPNANPAPMGYGLELRRPPTVVHTVALMAARIGELFQANPDTRLAILVRENRQGEFVADCLRSPQLYNIPTNLVEQGLEIFEVGERGRQSAIPGEMLDILRFLSRPHSPAYLKTALQGLMRRQLIPALDVNAIATNPEAFLYPGPLDNPATAEVATARRYCT
ncbi:MAG: ATP-dependent helicase, partial [Leptolyngbyaceae bacterium]|nr:ATP-dependent helicase [Leptolyngbyaceae bacterium]